MNIRRLMLLCTLLLTSCASDVPGLFFETRLIDGPMDLKVEAYQFLDACKHYNRPCRVYNLNLKWVDDLSGNRVGTCELEWQGPLFKQTISIVKNLEYWEVRNVMLHEMTHCTRFVDHHPGNEPHLMRTYMINETESKQKPQNEWEAQLFEWNGKLKGCPIGVCK
jgi:hypothetical protein